ncbi:MAG: Histidine-tRNA ligase [Candidatus Uhrbacteria bacterium GW2011_GWA2_52_8d]|uniref:Histidine-tRNA ligase n=1 Tax=Candidatus Uhrbacteria bacterium GW2011_GWA2_52_8d TaxID=1618979 RepID=A0A0G1XIF8_9BACT|nr:MAG: Histidine-tRNA ligase [Candidatus Uhrbacteria bacterium GW2011_GWA2_52_8d]
MSELDIPRSTFYKWYAYYLDNGYDGLIDQLGGEKTPAVGFASGIERIILNLKRQNMAVPATAAPRFFVACLGETAALAAFKLTAELRRASIF